MERLAFISDDRYISEETRGDVKEAVEENFPDLNLDLLSTTQLSTEMLLDTLRCYKPNTGIIYYSWFESHNKNDNNYLFDHIQEVIVNFTPSPLFLLSPEDLSNNTFAGGYYVSTESFCKSVGPPERKTAIPRHVIFPVGREEKEVPISAIKC